MTKSMWIAVSILFLLFASCAAFMTLLQKDEDKKNIDYFLTRQQLNQNILYNRVSFSLSDKYFLKDVSLVFKGLPNLKNTTRSFVIKEYREKNGSVSFASFQAKKIRLNLKELAQAVYPDKAKLVETLSFFNPTKDILKHPLLFVLLAQCQEIKANISVDYHYDFETKKMTLLTRFTEDFLGDWTFSVSLENISQAQQGQLEIMLTKLLKGGEIQQNLDNFFKDVKLSALSFSYKEKGLIQGYKKYIDTIYLRMPEASSPTTLNDKQIQQIVSYLSFSSAHQERNQEIAEDIAKFLENPKYLSIQTTLKSPVPLNSLQGDFLRKVTDIFLRLRASLSLKDNALEF